MSPPAKNPFFKASDLHRLEFKINGTNQTSQLRLPKDQVQLIQILDDGLLLSIPPRSCSMGHIVVLEVFAKKTLPTEEAIEHRTSVTATVKEIESSAGSQEMVRVVFREHHQIQWDALIQYFSDRQTAVNTLVKNTRG